MPAAINRRRSRGPAPPCQTVGRHQFLDPGLGGEVTMYGSGCRLRHCTAPAPHQHEWFKQQPEEQKSQSPESSCTACIRKVQART